MIDDQLNLPKLKRDESNAKTRQVQADQLMLNTGMSVEDAYANVQSSDNYDSPSRAQLEAEALEKLAASGEAGQYGAVSASTYLVEENGVIVARDSTTDELVADVSEATSNESGANNYEQDDSNRTNSLKVTISQQPTLDGRHSSFNISTVVFTVMPTIAESRSASYKSFTPLQHPGEILKYDTTQSRSWSISARLVARTIEEATDNLNIINTIRSWVMPFYGVGTAMSESSKRFLGAPPPILTLSAYGRQMIGPVKCVLESYSWDFPNDVDYLPTNTVDKAPFPVLLSVSLTLKESWSPVEYSGFSIVDYRNGDMAEAFKNRSPVQETPITKDEVPVETQTATAPVAETQVVQKATAAQPQREEDSWRSRGRNGTRWTMQMGGSAPPVKPEGSF